MVRNFILAFLFLLYGAVPLFADIRITVEGVRSYTGYLMVGLYRQKGYPEQGREWIGKRVKAAPEVSLKLEGIPPGRYAISVYHDENGNGVLDKTIFGIPKEGYGFSRNAKGGMAPPLFEESSFLFDGQDIKFIIYINY